MSVSRDQDQSPSSAAFDPNAMEKRLDVLKVEKKSEDETETGQETEDCAGKGEDRSASVYYIAKKQDDIQITH